MREYPQYRIQDIEELTDSQLTILLDKAAAYRKVLPIAEVTLTQIKSVLFAAFEVKEKEKEKEDGKIKTSMPLLKMSETEIKAYEKAKYPSPLNKWLRNYRRGK